MTILHVTCERGDGWWVAQCVEDPGLMTQARRLDQIPDMIRDAAELFDEFNGKDLDIVLEVIGDIGAESRQVRAARAEAEEAQQRALELSREFVRQLSSQGLSYRDAGQLLGVSHQYAQKLART